MAAMSYGKRMLKIVLEKQRSTRRNSTSPDEDAKFYSDAGYDRDRFIVKHMSDYKGLGVVSNREFGKGDFLLEYVGDRITAEEACVRSKKNKENKLFFYSYKGKKLWNLSDDDDCKGVLPLDPDSDDLYTKVKDGILLCKLINKSVPDTIDERTINKSKLDVYRRTENHNLALNSALSIGCNVVNIGHDDMEVGRPHLVLGLLWQIIRIGLLSEVNLNANPGLVMLLEEGETIDDLLRLSPEEILLRWVNYHMRNAGLQREIGNFGGDIKMAGHLKPQASDVWSPLPEGPLLKAH